MQAFMRQNLTAEILANEICMRRTQYNGTFLVVEGATDVRFFKNIIEEKHCNIIDALGKQRAVATVAIIGQRKEAGALAVVDADFHRLSASPENIANILLTDTHDLETMMLQSPALDKVLAEFASVAKMEKLSEDIRSTLLRGAGLLGFLRFISHRDELNLKFKELSFERFVDKDNLTINIENMVTVVKNHSQKPGLNTNDIVHQIADLRRQPHDLWQVSCGHDIIAILSVGLRKLFGNQNPSEVKTELIETCLRLSYDYRFFPDTLLFRHIREWEYKNSGYKILPDNPN